MFGKLGIAGLLGVVLLLGGIGLAAWQNPIIAAAMALVVAGLGLVVYGMITNFIRSMGMGQMMSATHE